MTMMDFLVVLTSNADPYRMRMRADLVYRDYGCLTYGLVDF